MIELRIHPIAAKTGRLLGSLLARNGISYNTRVGTELRDAVVCYGIGSNFEGPTLNANCSKYNKLEQLETLSSAKIPVPNFAADEFVLLQQYPYIARKVSHHGGLDIRVCLQPWEARLLFTNGWDFFTQFVPSEHEYRVWIYRRKHLGTYEKVLAHPEIFIARARLGRNYKNGFAFRLVDSRAVPREAVDIASRAVDTLDLDFGAVDILQSSVDGQFLVLEVNTAPGVESEQRQVIQALANKITRWVQLGYPRRRGDRE